MKLGVFCPLGGPAADSAYVRTLGETAEDLGFDSLWVAEHVVLFDDYASRYPYAENGRIPARPTAGMLEPLTTLAFLAAVTSRIRLGTGVLLVPQRNPVYTAKEAANLDRLSGGRLDLGVGVGWLAEEFRAVGVPWARRGARTRSYVEVMRRLWCDDVSEYRDEFYELPACRQFPKPVQQPLPIHFGGESDAALARVAGLGQGWYGFDLDPAGLAERVQALDDRLAAHGRRRSEVTISVSPYLREASPSMLEGYRRAGADQVILVAFARDQADLGPVLEKLAGDYLETAHRLS